MPLQYRRRFDTHRKHNEHIQYMFHHKSVATRFQKIIDNYDNLNQLIVQWDNQTDTNRSHQKLGGVILQTTFGAFEVASKKIVRSLFTD